MRISRFSVLRIAVDNTEGLGDIALHGLRRARGDEAAKKIAGAVETAAGDRQRWGLVMGLGQTGSREATSTLVKLLDDESENVRNAAAQGLVEVKDPASVDAILNKLDQPDGTFLFRRHLVDALGRAGHTKALPRLKELLEKTEQEWRNLQPYVQRAIVRIETGNPDSQRLK